MLRLRRTVRLLRSTIRPRGRDTIWLPGPDPVRVLVAGAGVAAGYGVSTHSEALSGHIATVLHTATGRGVTVQPRTVGVMPARRLLAVLRPAGAHSYSVVVLAGCFLEAPLAPARAFSRRIDAAFAHLHATGGPDLRIVVLGLPVPAASSRAEAVIAARLSGANHWTRDAVENHPSARFVPAPRPVNAADTFTTDYYAALAHAVVEDGLHGLISTPRDSSLDDLLCPREQ